MLADHFMRAPNAVYRAYLAERLREACEQTGLWFRNMGHHNYCFEFAVYAPQHEYFEPHILTFNVNDDGTYDLTARMTIILWSQNNAILNAAYMQSALRTVSEHQSNVHIDVHGYDTVIEVRWSYTLRAPPQKLVQSRILQTWFTDLIDFHHVFLSTCFALDACFVAQQMDQSFSYGSILPM